ncbi:glucodextranase DOMON-like domain-containing protein [Lapillicoccus sp.]|uniref:glucodextranase DOMON-like domain-containing protein n=1 Tax=Lapillicoccus sp. TaxID=1909287 RepID=UPI0025D58161|nr:glucodextranase DOMON-like domain-containing protein [Lapillicoccus sp.]
MHDELSTRPSLRRSRSRWSAVGAAAAVITALVSPLSAAAQSAPAGTAAAADGPGAVSHQDQSRKDCVGTARNRTSKIWYTIADGVLSDVYAPTVDATNVETMQYLVTDGSTFTDLQTRDTTYTASSDPTGMICTITSTAKSKAYKLVSTYLTDPTRDSVVVHTQYVALTAAARQFQLLVRLDANAGGNGGGGTANGGADSAVVDTTSGSPVPVSFDRSTTSQASRAYAVPSFLALRADQPFTTVSSGFVGQATDGLTQLDSTHTLKPVTQNAIDGNVEQTAAITRARDGSATLALGFGTTRAGAVATAGATVSTSLPTIVAGYEKGWLTYDAGLRFPLLTTPSMTGPQRRTATEKYYQSANVVKASEDKTFPGAIVAGLDAPWGQSIAANNPGNLFSTGYREVFGRDLYEAWTALYTDGDVATARDTVRYLLLTSQLADGSQPRNSLLDGTKAPDAFNIQLDEAAYPILMAWQSGMAGDDALWPHIQAAANFLISHGPSFGVERWEEQTGYSPSTISAEIAGLVAAGTIARQHGDAADARIWLATADQYQRSIKTWGVTFTGSLSASPYFIRLSKTGDPDAAISYNLGNGGATVDQRDVVDLGFLEYVRLGELPASDPVVASSLAVADATLMKSTASGSGWLRYNGDGYGDCVVGQGTSCPVTGAPWNGDGTFTGLGHPWPVLGVERAQQYLAQGKPGAAAAQLVTVNKENSGPGLVPEQVWDYPDLARSPYGTDPAVASIGFTNGQADGSASPLTWAAASQVRLTADLAAGRALEQPAAVRDRYLTHPQGGTALSVTSPTDQTAVGAQITVSGTAAPNARIDIAEVATDTTNATTVTSVTAARNGTFTAILTSAPGTNTLVITSTTAAGTAQVVRTVVSDAVNGTLIYGQDDPTGDDNGPGTYAYPTASDFHAGAFDLTNFQVYDTGTTLTFRTRTADLTSTFGSVNGAQLVDVYVHDPGAATSSTAAAFPGRNYTIAPAAAWSRLIEVEGFGVQSIRDTTGASTGTVTVAANSITGYTTFTVDKTALGGTPSRGWGFTVTLTGQDGFSPDQARAFTVTPGAYTFGVCAPGGTSPLCSVEPGAVPKVMDLLTPAGVSQATELDPTIGPVVLHDVTIP